MAFGFGGKKNNQPEDVAAVPEQAEAAPRRSLTRRFASFAAWTLTSPIWGPYYVAHKVGWEDRSAKSKATTAAVVYAPLTAAFAGAAIYSSMYAATVTGDYYWFGQAYEAQDKVGTVTALGITGKWPCNTIEGQLSLPNLGKDGSSTFPFSVRTFGPINAQTAQEVEDAFKTGATVSLSYRKSHYPKEYFDPEQEGWWLPSPGNFDCYQKTDTNITHVEVRSTALPQAPKFPGAR